MGIEIRDVSTNEPGKVYNCVCAHCGLTFIAAMPGTASPACPNDCPADQLEATLTADRTNG